ncbi:tRNA (adenosine(37)-N6)-dimethylallyltransferase MiaA [Apilactobacillus xinyiensis]|uniref:tRNA dimethylallyltransferase n=1 Tax=Apilactobacillus xinyiensis TaxID=2841032 RepID=A0ABT0I171_9LACO|nr:tRNA (adenosine(37)-N6)-dimethylallyltransferase MiaA [Apilactobacillus xinyiensis]MCK8624192.1 tRNA (adenosine(37)-N6)-dimethylallyltransferase MiaA [Apilactobacillus xinyiensis]MCL0318410.1 tRNA (adenosine(37)-N6)-dimethylallyltransferase MiaA [Apilactobacillus xinyiensis]
MKKLLLIAGPTAVGKTSLSIKLAKKFNGEIISGDSMQVYKHLDVGTAKITKDEMQGIPHHLLNIRDIDERYTVSDFVHDARICIDEVLQRNKLPIVVGGTGFYLQSLLGDFQFGGDSYNGDNIRNDYHHYALQNGKHALWIKLLKVDPESARKIPEQNERRVTRALEVLDKTGIKFSEQSDDLNNNDYDYFTVCLNTDRDLLYNRINQRVLVMIQNGLEQEALWLYKKGGSNVPAGKGIGYREFYPYFRNKITLDNVIDDIQKDSRHYAKRQLTWFRNKMNVTWYDIVKNKDNVKCIENDVGQWIQH